MAHEKADQKCAKNDTVTKEFNDFEEIILFLVNTVE